MGFNSAFKGLKADWNDG